MTNKKAIVLQMLKEGETVNKFTVEKYGIGGLLLTAPLMA